MLVAIILIGIGFTIKMNIDKGNAERENQIIDYIPPLVNTNDFSAYRKSANALNADFDPELGEEIFYSKCAPCHSLNGGKILGPSLNKLFERVPSTNWLIEYMNFPDSILKIKSPYHTQLIDFNKAFDIRRVHTDSFNRTMLQRHEIIHVIGFLGMTK